MNNTLLHSKRLGVIIVGPDCTIHNLIDIQTDRLVANSCCLLLFFSKLAEAYITLCLMMYNNITLCWFSKSHLPWDIKGDAVHKTYVQYIRLMLTECAVHKADVNRMCST